MRLLARAAFIEFPMKAALCEGSEVRCARSTYLDDPPGEGEVPLGVAPLVPLAPPEDVPPVPLGVEPVVSLPDVPPLVPPDVPPLAPPEGAAPLVLPLVPPDGVELVPLPGGALGVLLGGVVEPLALPVSPPAVPVPLVPPAPGVPVVPEALLELLDGGVVVLALLLGLVDGLVAELEVPALPAAGDASSFLPHPPNARLATSAPSNKEYFIFM